MIGPIIILILILFAIVFYWSIRIVREYQRLVLFRLGRCVGDRGPGVVWLIPVADQAVRIDLREQFLQIPHQTCITKDNAPIAIDFLIYWQVIDPVASVLHVANFAGASQGLATTTLRAVIGDIPLDDVLAQRDQINQVLRSKLDEVTERWGVKITTVEIREIVPPKDVQEAMNRQMTAERSRRATVTEAEGKRQALITVAEGDKQSAILQAEGARQATILRAEGDRQAQILQAEGYSLALDRINSVARLVDSQTLSLQYLEGFKLIGQSDSTKVVIPMEVLNMLRPFGEMIQRAAGTAAPVDGAPMESVSLATKIGSS
ncbi:MAG TPA: SPFH domain-containing protein [Chloroflexota bacterium]|nr:SPFH domain-containing protein [Chloroflexota bacterium]